MPLTMLSIGSVIELDGVLGLEAVGPDVDIDHRHRNLRLLLARQGDQRDEAEANAASSSSGVSGEVMKARVRLPAMPRPEGFAFTA